MRIFLLAALAGILASCRTAHVVGPKAQPPEPQRPPAADVAEDFAEWYGVYSSPREIGSFSGTVLALRKSLVVGVSYRMSFHSDVRSTDDIPQDQWWGTCLVDKDRLFVPMAFGRFDEDRRPQLQASIELYTRRRINGRTVLLRDDALKAYTERNELYDYGILIKVSDEPYFFGNLAEAEHVSIKVLYADPSRPWKDPFVPRHE